MGGSQSTNITDIIQKSIQKSVTNVVNKNSSKLSQVVTNINDFNLDVRGVMDCGEINVTQTIKNNADQTNVLDMTNISTIVSDLKTALKNDVSQLVKGVFDMLGGLGSYNTQENTTKIEGIVKQIIENNITNEQVAATSQSVFNQNKASLIIRGTFRGKKCIFTQTIISDAQAEAISKSIANTIAQNRAFSEMANKVQQINDMETKGLTTLVGKFTVIVIAIVIGLTVFFAFGGSTAIKSITNPTFLIVISVIIIVFVGGTYLLKIGPFNPGPPPHYWGCEEKDGMNTGHCIEFSEAEKAKGPYPTAEICQQYCFQHFGCEKDDQGNPKGCKQYPDALKGPFFTAQACQSAISDNYCCSNCWVCADSEADVEKDRCIKTDDPKQYYPTLSVYKSESACKNVCKPKPDED